jgi:DNA polymerase elongation subunit (family B)
MYLQPCDWIEQDIKNKYVVDVYGRTHEGDISRVRITDFKPYFYLRSKEKETSAQIAQLLSTFTTKNGRHIDGIRIEQTEKLDAMNGFAELKPIKVWKIIFSTLWSYKLIANEIKHKRVSEDIFESNLPPYLRLFHECNINPASPIEFEGDKVDGDLVCFEVPYTEIKPFNNISIPLYVLSYDIEVYSDSGNFPVSTNFKDEIIQIGLSFRWSDDLMTPVERYVLISGTCEPSNDPSLKFVACANEQDLLMKFQQYIQNEDPDIIVGYNTFGFDDGYIADRAAKNTIELNFGRVPIPDEPWRKKEYITIGGKEYLHTVKTEKKTFELASGKFAVRYFDLPGRLSIDLLLSIRREQNLDSYKLDSVASTFLRDKVIDLVIITGAPTRMYEIHTKSTRGLFVGNYVRFDIVNNTINPYADGTKFKVKSVFPKKFIIELDESNYLNTFDISVDDTKKLEWSFSKDDVSPQDMFAMHKKTAKDRSIIAKYCIQDCDLVLTLMAKLDTLVNARGMADVCKVPIGFIFLRGQGIKIYSTVVYNASKRNQIIMTQDSVEGDMSYEGAVVLPPKIGMYLDHPIPVLDFNSLYPSNMIAFNISPDSLVYIKTYNQDGKKIKHEGSSDEEITKLKLKYTIDEISFDIKENDEPIGKKTCGFVQPCDSNTIGLLPITLDILLKKRKETRKLMETTEDDAQRSVLNGLQLAYKVVANSIYGQTGSKTSPIRKVEIAACTTATGRERLMFAKNIAETEFGGEVIAGDTDSIFVKYPTKDLREAIELGKKTAERITSLCRKAHKIEYEKTFYPFILFCRKRYVGLKYEDDPTKCKRVCMGIALKRRDNAPIVKDIFGGALDILMEERSLKNAQIFVKNSLIEVLQNKIPLDKFIITKQLRDDYKNPGQIAHRVLADRMEERDAGNAPQVGDRLAYIYVENRKDEKKQGDRIEHVDFVKKRNLKPDVEFYIKNQIQNPVAQLFALGIEELDGWIPKKYPEFNDEQSTLDVLKIKEKELDSLMFLGAQYLKKHKRGPMDMFLKRN